MEAKRTFTVKGNVNAAEAIASLTKKEKGPAVLADAYLTYSRETWESIIAAAFNDDDKSEATQGIRRWRQATKKHILAGSSIASVAEYMLTDRSKSLTELAKRYCPELYIDAHKLINKPLTAEAVKKLYAESSVPAPAAPLADPILTKK